MHNISIKGIENWNRPRTIEAMNPVSVKQFIKEKLNFGFSFRDQQLPPGKGAILHSFMMATHSSLTPKENVAVFQFMEEEVQRLAQTRGFAGIFTTNTSPLTQVSFEREKTPSKSESWFLATGNRRLQVPKHVNVSSEPIRGQRWNQTFWISSRWQNSESTMEAGQLSNNF